MPLSVSEADLGRTPCSSPEPNARLVLVIDCPPAFARADFSTYRNRGTSGAPTYLDWVLQVIASGGLGGNTQELQMADAVRSCADGD